MLALSQVEQSLKFELLIPVHSSEQPTACMSFNYHHDHFGQTGADTKEAALAHTGCVAFGIDRLRLALFATHGVKIDLWPERARETLGL